MSAFTLHEHFALLRCDLMAFIERGFYTLNPETRFIPSPFIELIVSKLEACRRGEIKRLIINLPPRSLKSHCVSISFIAWLLGHNPSVQIIAASYGQDLADKFARDTRTLMESFWYQRIFSTRLKTRQSASDFSTTRSGNRMATSIGGVLTGRGGDFIIIDDPLKPDDALSETKRKGTNEWFDNTLLSRLNDKSAGCIIIIMQRLHQDDLVGHVREQGHWEVLSFPAVAETDECVPIVTPYGTRYFRRRCGEALHPEREPLATLAEIRHTVGEYHFMSQYQQNPAPLGGAMVKTEWLKWYEPGEEPGRFSRIIQSWDTANKAGELNDYSVCTTWGVNFKEYYLLNVFRKKMNFPDLKRAVVEQHQKFQANTIVIEDKASGTQLIQELREAGVLGVQLYKPPPGSDKIMRLHAQTTAFENGLVRLPTAAPWKNDYVAELTSFPGCRYDDQIDSTSQALDYLRSTHTGLEVWARLAR